MGQKTHPKGFRLVTTQKHLSKWYSNKKKYSTLLEEDSFIRLKVNEFFKEFLSISKIKINRVIQNYEILKDVKTNNYINITIYALFPRAKNMYQKVAKYFTEITNNSSAKIISILTNSRRHLKSLTTSLLKRNIRNFIRFLQIKNNKTYYVGIKFIKNSFLDATLIAKYIADQLEKRTPFRRILKQTITKVQCTTIKGIKVEVSGRLNGNDIARTEWKRNGKVPLHTLEAKIDYTHQYIKTIYGIVGIKIWLFIKDY